MWMWKLLAGVLGASTLGLVVIVLRLVVERARLRRRFAGIVDVERDIALRRHAFDRALATRVLELDGRHCAAMDELGEVLRKTAELQHGHAAAAAACARVRAELAALDDAAEIVAVGLYPPSFSRAAPDDYKHRLREAREHQRALVRDDQALAYGSTWSLGHSRSDAARMQRQYARLLLRAFNGECDAAIARVRWDNVPRMAERLTQAFRAINRLGTVLQIELTERYRDSKLDELRLEHELDQQRSVAHDDAARGLARGSIQVQLASHAPRTADPIGVVSSSGRTTDPRGQPVGAMVGKPAGLLLASTVEPIAAVKPRT